MTQSVPWLIVTMFCLVSCGTPFEYQSAGETPKGPGLFSGPTGDFTLHSDSKAKTADKQSNSTAAPQDFREFQDYQEFQRWKTSVKDTPEYREFQDWREWKAYRAWKTQQSK